MLALLKRGSEYSIKLLLGVNIRAKIFRMEKQNITISHEEGDMGVYGIAVFGFFSCVISVILMTVYLRFPFRYNAQNKTQ